MIGLAGKPFALVWAEGLKRVAMCRTCSSGTATVGPRWSTAGRRIGPNEKFYEVAAITAGLCERIGWQYLLAGEPEPVRASNLRWLAGYRRPFVRVAVMAERLVAAASSPMSLLQLAESVGEPIAVLPTLVCRAGPRRWRSRPGDLVVLMFRLQRIAGFTAS